MAKPNLEPRQLVGLFGRHVVRQEDDELEDAVVECGVDAQPVGQRGNDDFVPRVA